MTEPIRLNVGSGERRLDGYICVDKYVQGEGIVQGDMLALPYADGSVDEIFCSHALEHLSFADAPKALAEWLRVLRTGGTLTLVVPNMEWVAAAYLHGTDRRLTRQLMWGNQQHEGEFHHNGWKPLDLVGDVQTAGFEVTDVRVLWTPEYSQESIIVEARKPEEP
jgi:predicted SAM-dependent methyltransferase